MSCSCIHVGDYDGPTLYHAVTRTACKVHKCGECRREIKPGERYEYVAGKWDGEFCTYKTCLDCVSIREAFFCDGWEYGGVWEYLGEHIRDLNGNVSEKCLASLTPDARAEVCELIESLWRDDDEDHHTATSGGEG